MICDLASEDAQLITILYLDLRWQDRGLLIIQEPPKSSVTRAIKTRCTVYLHIQIISCFYNREYPQEVLFHSE